MTMTKAQEAAVKFEEERERRSLAQLLRDGGTRAPGVNLYSEEEIAEALDGGLTRDDIEWNQRLDRPWTYKGEGEEETQARLAHYG